MDGNGRWARSRGLERFLGHRKGTQATIDAVEVGVNLKLEHMTLYVFSSENWGRPSKEVDYLMNLLIEMVVKEIPDLMEKNVKLKVIGNMERLPEKPRTSLQSAIDKTPDSYSYGTQIPYIARNTVIVDGSIAWKGWNFIPLWQFRGGRSDGTGDLPDWNTLDVTVAKSVDLGSIGTLVLKLSVRNALDNRYEMVSGYPMPGRSITGGLELRF